MFAFDFTKVYWNSRLHTEHDRLVQLFSPDDVIADVFAGVGPFALPAAKKGCGVLANDLNPESYKWLSRNIETNKVSCVRLGWGMDLTCPQVQHLVRPFGEDGRDFIKAAARRAWGEPFPEFLPRVSWSQAKREKRALRSGEPRNTTLVSTSELAAPSSVLVSQTKLRRHISHFVMNLPDNAIEFLDSFRGVFAELELREAYEGKMPMVHCHCFTRETGDQARAEGDVKQVGIASVVGCYWTLMITLGYTAGGRETGAWADR